jgi:hypothetical protein
MSRLHLVTQDRQPYGSVRRCCEECGLAVFAFYGEGDKYVDDKKYYNAYFARGNRLRLCVEKGGSNCL